MSQQFGAFTASELYCPRCRRAQPVREKLLLILPSGELHEYLCTGCGASLGQRTVSGPAVTVATARRPVLGPRQRPPRTARLPAVPPRRLLR